MKNPKETKKPTVNNIEKLKNFLKEEFKPPSIDIRPPMLTNDEMENFFKQNVLTAFNEIKKELSEYKFVRLGYETHTRIVILKIVNALNLFHFKVDINNDDRQIKIFYSLRYRHHIKKKLFIIKGLESETISFNDIGTINNELILSLFIKWYTNKEETIEKDKEKSV